MKTVPMSSSVTTPDSSKVIKEKAGSIDDEQLQRELAAQLGRGPMRFGPVRQVCSFEAGFQHRKLSAELIERFDELKERWEMLIGKEPEYAAYTDCEILRMFLFCDCSRKRTLTFMKKINPKYFKLSAMELGGQIRTRTLFPCPGLKTRVSRYNVFYMRPSRYDPSETPVELVVDNLVYVMDQMTKKDPKRGIALLANMEGWTMANFSIDYCRKFMSVLQGNEFPAKVEKFFILNPPSWFNNVWVIMKPMLSAAFRQGVHMVKKDELPAYLDLDFEEHLPDEVQGGKVDTGVLVRDFLLFQKTLEWAMEQSKQEQSVEDGSTPWNKNILPGYANRRKKIDSASRAIGILRRLSLGKAS